MHETFFLDGVDARSVGIQLQEPISFSEAVPVLEQQSIAGRNGDLIYFTGAYENRGAVAQCYALQFDVNTAVLAANKFLLSKSGYRRLQASDDPDHYWMAHVENGAEVAQRMRTLNPFTISFDCKPQRFLTAGKYPVSFTESGVIVNQYGFKALPFVTVYGSGSGNLTIGNRTVRIDLLNNVMFLDSDTQNAYNEDGNQNANINAPEFPVLEDGENTVHFDGGITKVEIIPRWWEL